jgi:hypothetical protein
VLRRRPASWKRFVRASCAATALVCLLVVAGCDKSEPPPPPPAVATIPSDVAPCFPDDGPVAFVVEGVPVPEKAVLRFAAYLRAREPGLSQEQAKEFAVTRVAFPVAAVYAAGLKANEDGSTPPTIAAARRAAKNAEAARGGADFKTLAEDSDDLSTKVKGGDAGKVSRSEFDQVSLGESAFALPRGGTAGPVFSLYGAHVLRVSEIADGASPQQDRRQVAHIVAAYDPEAFRADPSVVRKRAQAIVERSKATVVIDAYKKLIPLSARN